VIGLGLDLVVTIVKTSSFGDGSGVL